MTFTETMKRASELAIAIRHYWYVELRKKFPKYPLVYVPPGSVPPPPEDAEFRALLLGLSPEDFAKFLALVEVGRRTTPAAEFPRRWKTLIGTTADRDRTLREMLVSTYVGADVHDGLARLNQANIDVETVQPALV
jgi:hypothetical protein